MYNLKNNQGFTLMEIFITISLLVFMLSLITINYKSSNKRLDIIMSTRKMVSDFRLAQSYALSAKKGSGASGQNIWGIYLNKNKQEYYFFSSNTDSGIYSTSNDHIFQVLSLPPHILVSRLKCQTNASTNSVDNITTRFIPPDPKTKIIGQGSTEDHLCNNLVITLLDNVNNSTKEVTINTFGLIEESK